MENTQKHQTSLFYRCLGNFVVIAGSILHYLHCQTIMTSMSTFSKDEETVSENNIDIPHLQEINTESGKQAIDAINIERPFPRNVNDNTSSCVSVSIETTTTVDTSVIKRHIMISYNRSCENSCRRIRNDLKVLKYNVWMDVYDMHDNFIDGMAKAIKNSYIVLMCINRKYDDSFWCRKEAEDIAIKRIKFIPCFMEEPFPLEDWLQFLVGSNVWIDFSKADEFNDSFEQLIKEITVIEDKLATYPRETPSNTPMINPSNAITLNPTMATFDTFLGNLKTWVQQNHYDLKQFNRKQSAQFINQLMQAMDIDKILPDDNNKKELVQQVLLSTSQNQNEHFRRLINTLIASHYSMDKGLIFILAFWAVRTVFKKTNIF
ncbi:unnamed protein product [Rotaria magnacalcarata]|uniref:TIR domain-containing protein n=1 Tax=Rotaria magnacalcarata TaxID=392030 RepID=A0A816ZXU9_9BILA|nr:unnamed protein product [Rotaria magnacalcarata]